MDDKEYLPAIDGDQKDNGETSQIQKLWIPDVEEDLKPRVGKLFESIEEAYDFYNKYAYCAGFSVRSSSHKYKTWRSGERDNEKSNCQRQIVSKYYVCSREGEHCAKKETEYKTRGSKRVNCFAQILLSFQKVTCKWKVAKFIEGHSHPLTSPSKLHLSHLEIVSSGFNNTGCKELDLRNSERDLREAFKDGDVEMLLEYFKDTEVKNSSFFHSFRVDEENRLTHCFWIDAISRKAYSYFGDVVWFDTSFNTNKYGLYFAMFSGVNHHGQTVIFGCGFIRDQTTDSFLWLMDKWLEGMSGQHPKTIITDQDSAIAAAISLLFPNTYHLFCIWHVLRMLSKKLGPKAHAPEFIGPFKLNLWESETPDEFVTRWHEVIDANGLQDNGWLDDLFKIREKWVPTYLRNLFFVGMNNSQRSECINSVLQIFVTRKITLFEFAFKIDKWITLQRERELKADSEMIHFKPEIKSAWKVEKQMSEIYTKDIFCEFQRRLIDSLVCVVVFYEEDPIRKVFKVGPVGDDKDKKIVTFHISDKKATCSCLFFDFQGIPCKHILAFLMSMEVVELPEQYILGRWTRFAKTEAVSDNEGKEISEVCDEPLNAQANELGILANMLVDEGSSSIEYCHMAQVAILNCIDEIRKMKNQNGDEEMNIKEKKPVTLETRVNFPEKLNTRGGKRNTLAFERDDMPQRRCSRCRRVEHDIRNCPLNVLKPCMTEVHEINAKMGEELPSSDEHIDVREIGSLDNCEEPRLQIMSLEWSRSV